MSNFQMKSEPVLPPVDSANFDQAWKSMQNDFLSLHIPSQHGNRQVGVALCGLGRMGTIHLYNLVREPRVKLLYVLDADEKRFEYMRKINYLDARGVKFVKPDGLNTILADKAVEVCIICTPTFTHENYAKSALTAGKHVLCEKPLALKLDDVKALYKLAADKNLKLICAFNRRYDPSLRQIQRQVRNGEVGPIQVIKLCSRDSPTPKMDYIKTSGGVFHDCLIHDVDLILWYMQELPVEVHAYSHCYMEDYKEVKDFDTCVVMMKFKSGAMGVIDTSRISSYGYDQRVEVFGPRGMLKLDECKATAAEQHDGSGVRTSCTKYTFSSRYAEAYATEISDLLNHVEGNPVLNPVKPHTIIKLCEIMDACEHSARTGETVKFNWDKDVHDY